ncbi:hypothetical protein CYY_001732 [Polysphondylium violaceum]|uniref:non-specific serine/threonine protein kinase n=1 Tax=Polysphondylium violaceum TaxID=133409 RepID=A0A8J4PZM4_9MYCE|nr:hypothetical protein CYY_001732 [Polysphondylium violaceum]
MNPPTDPLAGYKIIKVLRSGGEGKAILLSKGETYYVCKERAFDSLIEATAGLNEAYALASINHPNVVKLEGVSVFEREKQVILCIIMEYCPKGDLLDFLLEISDTISEISDQTSDTDSVSSKHSSTDDLASLSISSEPTSSSTSSKTSPSPNKHNNNNNTTAQTCTGFKINKIHKKEERKCIIKMTMDLTKAALGFQKKKPNGDIEIREETIESSEFKKNGDSKFLIEQNQLIEWILQLFYGVQALHKQRLIHRDLKSENIFIASNNSLKIGDFGLAYKTTSKAINVKGAVGTYPYSAPEVLEGKAYDKSADIFSLGCILFEMITLKNLVQNRFYFGQEMIDDTFCKMGFISNFPQKYERLSPIVLRMLDKNPNLRPSIENLIEQFENMDSSTLREDILLKQHQQHGSSKNFKGMSKQLERQHFAEASKVLAQAFLVDPRFSSIFPPDQPTSLGHLTALFEYLLKVIAKKAVIWGAFTLDNRIVSVMVWFNPDKQKKIKITDVIVGGINFLTRYGLKRVKQVSHLLKFIDEILVSTNKTKEKYWFLAYVATLEGYRNTGVGTDMLKHITNWADHSGLKCKTFSFANNSHSYFNRLGFETINELNKENTKDLPKGVDNVWILERNPKPLKL